MDMPSQAHSLSMEKKLHVVIHVAALRLKLGHVQ